MIVIVFVVPDPLAVTPDPTKLSVVAAVDNEEPSSCIVISPPDCLAWTYDESINSVTCPESTKSVPRVGTELALSFSAKASKTAF